MGEWPAGRQGGCIAPEIRSQNVASDRGCPRHGRSRNPVAEEEPGRALFVAVTALTLMLGKSSTSHRGQSFWGTELTWEAFG